MLRAFCAFRCVTIGALMPKRNSLLGLGHLEWRTLQSCFSSHLVGSTGRVVVFEEGGVHLIHSSEVVDVGQQDGGLHHVVEGAVGRLQDVA